MDTSTLSPAKQALLKRRLTHAADARVQATEIPRRPDPESAPLSSAQRQMWVIDQMMPGNTAYGLPIGYRLRGPLNAAALEKSFNLIIARHESLRTTFTLRNGEPLQVIHPAVTIAIDVTGLDHLPHEHRENRLQALASEQCARSFDLSRLPLIRVSLFKLGDAEHVLIINVHHIVADGLSIGPMLDEVDTYYRAFAADREPHPPDLAVQYADFAQWQQQTRSDDAIHADQIDFWRKQLAGPLPVLDVPADKPRPARQSFKGSNVFLTIPRMLVDDLKRLGAREDCTFFMTVLAAFQVLLQRYSGANDIVIGTPVAARTHRELEPLIGNFLNMVALRCDLSGIPTFRDILRRTRETALDAFSNSAVPFEAVVRHLTFERDVRRNPVFQTLIQALSTPAPRMGDLEVSHYQFDPQYAQFDLSLLLYEEPGGYWGRFEYCTDLFHADTVERLSSNFLQLLHAVCKDPDQSIATLSLLSEAERQLLVEWNDTAVPCPQLDVCLHQLIEAQVARTPERTAVVSDHQTLTYRELDGRANQLAHHLRALGVGPDVLVGLFVERSFEMVVGLLGILKAGAAYVPLDPSFPPDRLEYMMDNAGISLLVTQARLRGHLPDSGRRAICLDADWERIQREDSEDPHIPVGPSNLAYTIYTSGSTGAPKGVMIEHGSVVNFLRSMQQEPGFDETDVLVAVTTISFDIAALEMFLPLMSGGRLVIASRNEAIDGSLLLQRIEESRATMLQATPATWKLMLEAGWKKTPGLKMLCGGEALPRELANRMLERGGQLWNMYGPTETTIWSSVRRIEPGPDPVLIGRPMANTQFYIVDKELKPVPIGVAGELLIGGDGVARGYLDRPELTAERFVENPFPGSRGRLYRTGDLARFRSDGSIEFLGRLDFQVKVRGYRIELGEIEYVLTHHAGVKDAVVMTREDPDGDTRLIAYCIPSADKHLSVDDLRQVLQQKLPPYMVPSAFVPMDTFPLTANGKVDRKALPAPDERLVAVAREFVAPRDPLEHALARSWSRILKAKRVGVHDSFFDLGGHSLAAIRLVSEVQELTGKTLPLATLFEAPTVAGLADILRRDGWTPSWSSLVPIQGSGSRHPLFLVHAAHGHVLLYRQLASHLGSDQPVYGLQSEGFGGEGRVSSSVEEMASRYVKELLSVQPQGPYFLGGYCLGGVIALEIAQQLTALGKNVDTVVLLDSYNPVAMPRVKALLCTPVHWVQNLWFHAANAVAVRGNDRGRFVREKVDIALTRLEIRLRAAGRAVKRLAAVRRRQSDPYLAVKRANDQAASRYVPRPYSGRVVLIRSKGDFFGFANPSFGWSDIVRGDLIISELPVYPKGMLIEPYCRLLADAIGCACGIPQPQGREHIAA